MKRLAMALLTVCACSLAAGATIDSFSVSDPDTGLTFFTDSADVNVSLTASGPSVTGYQITETNVEPAEWLPAKPVAYTIATGEGDKVLYAWVKDSQGSVVSAVASIYYFTAVPEISNVRSESTSSSITVFWGTSVLAVGWVRYGVQGQARDGISDTSGYTTAHSVELINLMDDSTYEIEIHSNGATLLTTATTGSAEPTTDDVTWAGRAETLTWQIGANWEGFQPPQNPTPGRIILANTGAVADTSVTNILDADRAIGGLRVMHSADNHTLDLAGHALTATGAVVVGPTNVAGGRMTIAGSAGTLQVGTPDIPADLVVGEQSLEWSDPRLPQAASNSLTLTDLTLVTHVNSLRVGASPLLWYQGGFGTLDLRPATIANGTLSANRMVVGYGQGSRGYVQLNAASGLTDVIVRDYLEVSTGHGGAGSIGDPSNDYKLPADVNLTLGEWGEARCDVEMSIAALRDSNNQGRIVAASGGIFTGYIGTMRIGGGGGNATLAELDLKAMAGVTVDAQKIMLNSVPATAGPSGRAYLRLPAGTVHAAELVVSSRDLTSAGTESILQFYGTACTTPSVTVGGRGTVETHATGLPCGLDLPDAATPAIDGYHRIYFDKNPTDTGIYWGLRWQGNHLGDLGALLKANKIGFIVSSGVSGKAGIMYEDGFTYVCLKASWDAPTAMAKNLVAEISPPDFPTVRIAAADVDVSRDFSGRTIATKTITCPDDEVPDDLYVTLSTLGPHEVTLTVTNSIGVSDTTTCTVTVAIPTPVGGDLIWAGKAPTKEWLWGQNWTGGNPPASETSGVITFDAAGSATGSTVTNKLSDDCTIGGLIASYTSDVYHKTDLAGHRLTIKGTMMFGDRIPVKPFTISGGTLQMGTADSPAIITLGFANDFYEPQPTGTLNVSGAVETHLAECNVSYQSNWYVAGDSILNLTSTTFPDHTFASDMIRVGYRGYGYVKLPASGGLTQVVCRHLWLGNWGYGATGRFGVETNGYKLPTNCSLRIGTPEQLGSIWLGVDSELWSGSACDGAGATVHRPGTSGARPAGGDQPRLRLTCWLPRAGGWAGAAGRCAAAASSRASIARMAANGPIP